MRVYRKPFHLPRFFFPLGLFLLLLGFSSMRGQGPQPFPDPAAAASARHLVDAFFHFGSNPAGISPDSIEQYAVDSFAEYLERHAGEPFWTVSSRFSVDDVYKVHKTDSAAIVTARTWPDSLPLFGPLIVDWTWFLRLNSDGEWRISSVRRMEGLDKAIEMLRLLDTTDLFPDRIKPDIARENSTILLSNAQLRQEFAAARTWLDSLVGLVESSDSIRFVERTGDRISQFNMVMIDWGMAAEEVPQEVIDEFMATATEEERNEMETRLRTAQKQKEEGEKALQGYARRAGLKAGTLEKVVSFMKKGRVRFINADLEWDGAVLLTMAGSVNDAMGYLYSPNGELPLISPEEFFYLEDLGGGWWIFRAT